MLWDLARSFLKLGCVAFGGPAAHIALMEEEFVRRRGWLTREEFLDRLGTTALIPGPNSTELALFIGQRRAGTAGLLVAGLCFILPAALVVGVLAAFYVRYGRVPQAAAILYGIQPVILAIVAHAVIRLGHGFTRSPREVVLGLGALGLALYGVHPIPILVACGFAGAAPRLAGLALLAAAAPPPVSVPRVFMFFLKTGAVQFGSGYVLLSFLRADLVERWGWIDEKTLLDAIAVGQFTPGPVLTAATFLGYRLAGLAGAAAATVGIFLPAFLVVALSGRVIPRLRRSAIAGRFLDGVNVASLALMAAVCVQLVDTALVDGFTTAIAVIASAALLTRRLSASSLIVAGALFGWLRGFA